MKNKIKKILEEEKQQNKSVKEKENKTKNQEREIEDYTKNCDFFEKFPNENLFKNAQYGLNEILQFEKEDDKNRYMSLLINISYSNKMTMLCFIYSRFIIMTMNNFYINKQKIISILLYTHIFSFIISFIILKRKSKGYPIWIVKLIFDINQSFFIYFANLYNFESISPVIEFIYNGFSSYILNIQMKDIIYSVGIISIAFLYNYKIFKSNIIEIIFGNVASIICVYLIKKNIKYLWILYDSFKRSYRVVNNLFEYNYYPIFIISKNMDILYLNDAAKQFCHFIIKDKNNDSHSKINLKMEINFQKLIIPSLYNLFNELLEDSLNSDKKEGKFYFPFTTLNDNLTNLEYKKYTNLYLISEESVKLNWFSVICQNCIWKVHKSIFLNLIPSDEFIYNNIFNNQNKLLLEKYEDYIDNSNKMCEIILRCERNSIIPYSNSGKSYKRLGIYFKKNENDESVLSHENNFVFPNMDYSILFFFKNQSEILFDLLLTQNIYLSLLNPRTNFECYSKKEVNLEIFTNYFSFYFDNLLISKHFSLEFKIKENCKYIIIQDVLLRITIFNILLFILSNSHYNDKNNGIVISIRLSKEKNFQNKSYNEESFELSDFLIKRKNNVTDKKLTNNGIFSLEFDISITGENLLDYNKINKILKAKNLKNSILKSEVEKQILNIGILTVYYIITKYYKKEFTMNSNEKGNIILFKVTCEKKINVNNIKEDNEESSSFFQEKFYFYDKYYHEKLIKNIYNFDIPDNNTKLNIEIEKHINSNSLGKTSKFDDKKDNNNNKYINSKSFKKGLSLKNISVNKVKTELKFVEKEFLNKNYQFDSFGISKYKNN